MKNARLPALTAVLLLLGVSFANSQQTSLKNKLDIYMSAYVTNGDFSGNVLIVKDSKVLFNKSYGKANYDLHVPIQKDTKFRIASVSKTFTAAAIVMLQERKQLKYSDKLSKYIPDFVEGDSIKISDLLLHQSGIADIDYDKYALEGLTLNEIITTIKSKPLYFKPGSQSRYSNSGYLVLAYLLEKISGHTYDQFLFENIFKKLGMNNTGIDHKGSIISNKATGYSIGAGANGIAQAPWYDINLETGSGSLYSTTGDLSKWLQAIKNKTLFDIASWPYPFGWGKREYFKNNKSIEQSGFLSGYSSYIGLYPSENLLVIALSNINSNFGEQSGRDLAAIYFNENYILPGIRRDVKTDNLSVYAGKYSWPGYKDFYIEQKENTIYWRFADEKTGSPLSPISTHSFLLRLTNNKIIFETNDVGKAIALSFVSGNNTTTCKKIE